MYSIKAPYDFLIVFFCNSYLWHIIKILSKKIFECYKNSELSFSFRYCFISNINPFHTVFLTIYPLNFMDMKMDTTTKLKKNHMELISEQVW